LRRRMRRVAPKAVVSDQGRRIGPAAEKSENIGQSIPMDSKRPDADCNRVDRRKREDKHWHADERLSPKQLSLKPGSDHAGACTIGQQISVVIVREMRTIQGRLRLNLPRLITGCPA
jgi:hypothetical protein